MLALSAGAQFNFMAKMKQATTELIASALSSLGVSHMRDLYSSREPSTASEDSQENEQDVPRFDTRAEMRRDAMASAASDSCPEEALNSDDGSCQTEQLLYQLVYEDSDLAVLEHRISFLGCITEYLRSCLARWEHRNPDANESVWSPSLEVWSTDERRLFSFLASDSFVNCVQREDLARSLGVRLPIY